MDRHPVPRRVYFIGVAGRRTINEPDYDGLILRDDEQMRIVDFYSNLSAGGQFIPLVVEHDPSQQIGIVRHLWMLSDTRLGIIGELRGEAPVAREALLGRTLGLSVELTHPYDKAQHRIVGDRRINHVGVVVDPCWDDHRTYIKDISNDLDTIENVFLNDYYKMAVHMSQRDRARWGQLLMEKQKMATSGFSEGATREPEGIIYLRTGYNTTHTPQFTTTAPMDTTPTTTSPSAPLAPPATDEWSTLIKEYGATPEQVRAALEASRGQGLDLMEAVELARKKRIEDEEAAERKRREEAESIVAMNKQWIDTFAPYIKEEADMAFALSKMEPSATLSGSDMARMLLINTTASKAMQEALDHRKKEELYQAERAAKKAEAEAAAAKTAAAAAQQKARETPSPAAPKMETYAPASGSYSDYYAQLRKKREEEEQQREPVDFTSTAASKGGSAGPVAPTSAFMQTLSRLHGDINVDRFDGNRFSSISARGVDPSMFTASENSLRSHARPVGSEFETMRGQVFQVELPTGGH